MLQNNDLQSDEIDLLHQPYNNKTMKAPETIQEWIDECYGTAFGKGWWDDTHERKVKLPEKLLLMHSEISEVVEEFRNGADDIYVKNGKPEGVAIELADLLIRLFDMCGGLDIDLVTALKMKHAYNATRPYRHGGKVI